MNFARILSPFVVLNARLFFVFAALDSWYAPPPNQTSAAAAATAAGWIEIAALGPESTAAPRRTGSAGARERGDELRGPRRDRRRDRKADGARSRKKYSTHVPLPRPAEFAAPGEPAGRVARFETRPPPAPLRYLLPPVADDRLLGHRRRRPPAGRDRGSTKFRNTARPDAGDERDSRPTTAVAAGAAPSATKSSPLRPIVVRPVVETPPAHPRGGGGGGERDGAASRAEFVSPEVAEGAARPIGMRHASSAEHEPVVGQHAPPSSSPPPPSATNRRVAWLDEPSTRPQPLLRHAGATDSEALWPPTELAFQQPFADLSQNYIREPATSPAGHESKPCRARPQAGPASAEVIENNFVYQPAECVVPGTGPLREFDVFTWATSTSRNEYSTLPTTTARRTTAAATHRRTPYSPPSNRSQPNSFKGLELAESSYFSDLPSRNEAMTLTQNDVIPGTAGKDYPIYSQTLLRKRRFACRGLEGYFADISSRCQAFYICNGNGAGEPMLCPNGTLFSQELLVCDWWYNVDC